MIPLQSKPQKQRGMVLILAMLIVALVTSLVVATSWKFELGMARNENRWHGLQARLVMEGGERLVSKLLLMPDLQDPTPDGKADHLNEDWNAPQTVPIDGGAITVNLSDAQARFNLNLLSIAQPQLDPNTPEGERCKEQPTLFDCQFSVAQRRFIRFLQVIPLNERLLTPDEATQITQALIDWMDADNNVSGFGGAEQSYYQGLEVPIVVSNAPMTTVSELSLVKGITAELYERLLPYVIALPAEGDQAGHININTMPDLMFRMFNDKAINLPLDEQQGSDVARARSDQLNIEFSSGQGFQSVDDFVNNALVSNLQVVQSAQNFDNSQLSINTQYFIYSAEVMIGDKVRRGKTLMFRDNRSARALWRTDANF